MFVEGGLTFIKISKYSSARKYMRKLIFTQTNDYSNTEQRTSKENIMCLKKSYKMAGTLSLYKVRSS